MNQVAKLFSNDKKSFARANIDFFNKKTKHLPNDFGREMSSRYVSTYHDSGLVAANRQLLRVSSNVTSAGLALASDDDAIRQVAKSKAKDLARMWARYVSEYSTAGIQPEDMPPYNVSEVLMFMQAFCRNHGIEPPMPDAARNVTHAGCIRRLMCERWWTRNLRKSQARNVEMAAIELGMVSRYKSPYVSDASIQRRAGQKKRNASLLASIVAVNELGYERTLEELASKGVANPEVRFAEMITRLKGMEEIAEAEGMACDFWTLTCPSKMHASSKKYDGTTPREAQQYLAGVWAKFRAACKRRGIELSGMRVAEPHQDACPHWHLLLWVHDDELKQARALLHKYARKVDGKEDGAARNRAKVIAIDKSRGSAVGYVIKYIAKNVDGGKQDAFFSKNENGEKFYHEKGKDDAVKRVEAWASTWGIRQFQFVGSDSVTLWRELRRIRENEADHIKHDDIAAEAVAEAAGQGLGMAALKVAHDSGLDFSPHKILKQIGGEMLAAWGFADDNEWRGYARYAGVLELLRVTNRGEVNAYNEPKAKQIMGIKCGGVVLITRRHIWKCEKATKEQLELVEKRRGAAEKADYLEPWTRVNNCTVIKKQAESEKCLKNRHKIERSGFSPPN